ncbi:MAG TPA: hypothetical protein VNL77_16240 [Roseiflexaceae bacterium]|nr:hypothetical protein [Roseiflexaceae bacterium]
MSGAYRKLIFRGALPEPEEQQPAAVLATAQQYQREPSPSMDEALDLYSDESIAQLEVRPEHTGARHRRLPEDVPVDAPKSPIFPEPLNWTYQGYIVHARTAPHRGGSGVALGNAPPQAVSYASDGRAAEQPAAEQQLCLFNVIVAFEWHPSADDLRRMQWAFRRASDFLYDVTDGRMAFGQVVFGGPDLLEYADIQVFASSRLHPRAWVDGLHNPDKYTPIRLGRGMWPSRNGVAIPWNEPEGYRTIIHEWAHYALGLRDQYFERRGLVGAHTAGAAHASAQLLVAARASEIPAFTVVLGRQTSGSESIMATLEGTSELVPRTNGTRPARKEHEWQQIEARFPWLNGPDRPLEGPGRLPLPLPQFRRAGELTAVAPDPTLVLRRADLPPGLAPERFSVYLLRERGGAVERIIAQGGPDARFADDGLALYGVHENDRLVLVGTDQEERPVVYSTTVTRCNAQDQEELCLNNWGDAVTPHPLPVIDVIPGKLARDAGKKAGTTARVSVRVSVSGAGQTLPEHGEVWLLPAGQPPLDGRPLDRQPDDRAPSWSTDVHDVTTLDGHVLVRWDNKLMIAGYSHGGNPPSSTPANAPPITAGSSDGTVMLFFDEGSPGRNDSYSEVKVATVTACGALGAPPHPQARPWGPPVSLGANAALPGHLCPTLLLRYEQPGERELLTGDLLVCRLEGHSWAPQPTYLRAGTTLAAMPLTAETAGRLLADELAEPRVERYQLYWVPRT